MVYSISACSDQLDYAKAQSQEADDVQVRVYYRRQEIANPIGQEDKSINERIRQAQTLNQRADAAYHRAYLLGIRATLVVLLLLLGVTAYATTDKSDQSDIAHQEYKFFLLVRVGQFVAGMVAVLFSLLAFGPAIVYWLYTPVAGYTIGTLILASIITAIVLGAAYYDFSRRNQSPGQC
jgi:hypothetical protein